MHSVNSSIRKFPAERQFASERVLEKRQPDAEVVRAEVRSRCHGLRIPKRSKNSRLGGTYTCTECAESGESRAQFSGIQAVPAFRAPAAPPGDPPRATWPWQCYLF